MGSMPLDIFLIKNTLGPMTELHRLERTYHADAATIWTLWTTPAGIARWWAPAGFTTTVGTLELREGGELVYTMTATAPEAIEFMRSAGMPLATESRKRFTRVREPALLSYQSLVDFVPDQAPYEFATDVELVPVADGTLVTMTVEPLHDATWTQRLLDGRNNELDNLARVAGS
jgi:uncharacterized protein YndB with AHSA1/START domain